MKSISVAVIFFLFSAFAFAQTSAETVGTPDFEPKILTANFNAMLANRLSNFKVPSYVNSIKNAWDNKTLGFSVEFINENQSARYKEKEGIDMGAFLLGNKLMVAVNASNFEKIQALIDPGHPDYEQMSRGFNAVLIAMEMVFEKKAPSQRNAILNSIRQLSKMPTGTEKEKAILKVFQDNFSATEGIIFAGEFIFKFQRIHPGSNVLADMSFILDPTVKHRLDQLLLFGFLGGPDPWAAPPVPNNYEGNVFE
ncbi:MAG: hypothetical protein Q8P74_02345 [bacterium]|nr:hypothetical protein [bacterium]